MEEAYLHFVWQNGLFEPSRLKTTCGIPVTLLNRGNYNLNSGPDFLHARIQLDEKEWAGHVEIHIVASDWNRHGHQRDAAYNSTVLHVVHTADEDVYRKDGTLVPCLEIGNRLFAHTEARYTQLMGALENIPCAYAQPGKMQPAAMQMMHRALAERLLRKAEIMTEKLRLLRGDWDELFYRQLARYMGMKVNADAMETLAETVPLRLLLRHTDKPGEVHALLFGAAGMLAAGMKDAYSRGLYKTWMFLQHKYNLQSMNPVMWKFMRMHPGNFPTIRIAQLAEIVIKGGRFGLLADFHSPAAWKEWLKVAAPEYWHTHYRFGVPGPRRLKQLGEASADVLLINAVAPLLFAYGDYTQEEGWKERAVDLLCSLPAENNRITRSWQKLGFESRTAYDSQALLGLQELYCSARRCLDCAIGQKLLAIAQ